jgi:uncharacterized protein
VTGRCRLAVRCAVPRGDGRGVSAFLAIAFGLAWLPFLAQAAGAGSLGPVLMPVAPAVACLVVRRWVSREGFGDTGLRWRPNLRQWPVYLLVLLWPVAAAVCNTGVALALGRGGTGFTWPWGAAAPSWSMLAAWVGLSVVVVPVVLGEELGWRGYLQLRLFPARPLTAALATGFLWGIWHYPLILSGGEPARSTGLTLVALTVSTMTFSVFLGWVRSVTGSVWTTSAAHASNNVTGDSLQRLSFTGHQDGVLPDDALVPALAGEALVWAATLGVGLLRGSRPSSDRETFQHQREVREPGSQAVFPGHGGHRPGP